MPVNQIQLPVMYRKNTNQRSDNYQHYLAEVDRKETLTMRGLVDHIKSHGCAIGRDAIEAVIVNLSECIPELVAQGQPVKLNGLGIFYPTVQNKKGGATEAQMKSKDFDPTSIIEGVRFRFTPDSTDLDNLTSREFLTRSVSATSQYIVSTVKRTVDGKIRKIQVRQTLEDFRNPADQQP